MGQSLDHFRQLGDLLELNRPYLSCLDRQIAALVRQSCLLHLQASRSFRRNQPKLGQMPPQRVDKSCALSDQELVRPEGHRAALRLGTLHSHEPHRWARSRLRNGSASALSFFCRLTNGFTEAAGTRRTSWPWDSAARPQ
jgi:hypothetical protein